MTDIWSEFLVYYQQLQNIFIVLFVSAIIIYFLMKSGISNPIIIGLTICVVFIYLYAVEQFSNKIFSIVLLIAFTLIYFVWRSGNIGVHQSNV